VQIRLPGFQEVAELGRGKVPGEMLAQRVVPAGSKGLVVVVAECSLSVVEECQCGIPVLALASGDLVTSSEMTASLVPLVLEKSRTSRAIVGWSRTW
jgi:hypothetical protein